MLAWVLLALILLVCIGYVVFAPKDVDPYFVEHQASIAVTKQPGESPVFRSLVNDHGRVLLGSRKPLNQFRFQHFWDEADTFRILHASRSGRMQPVENFRQAIARVQEALASYPPHCEITMAFDISIEALVAYLAVVLSGRIPRLNEPSPEDMDQQEAEQEEVESRAILRQTKFSFSHGYGGITVLKDAETSVVISLFAADGFSSQSEDLTGEPVTVSSTESDFEVLRVGSNVSVSQVDLGVAIAGQLTSLGSQYGWNMSDTVFIAPGPLTAYSITSMLTALSAKAQLVFAELGPMMTASTVLQRAKPTILVTDDLSMRSLSKQVDDFQITSWIQYGVRRARLAFGALTKPGMIPGFSSVRLIHTSSGSDPFQWLTNSEMANLRVLSGTQVIHVYTPDDALPVCQTVIGDYRSGSKLPGVSFGPPLPGLELKTRKEELLILRANHAEFQAISSHCSEGAALRKDGCLYVPEKRHDFSDQYYYTGELK